MSSYLCGFCAYIRSRIYLITWISLVIYLFYKSFTFYLNGRQFFYLREMLGLGLCVSRGTATVLNLCCALILLPLCKKINHLLYKLMSKLWPGLFFFWLENAKTCHMTVAITLLLFAVVHSISHFINIFNFSRNYDEMRSEINMASYKNESPFYLLMSVAGVTGLSMLFIIISMGVTSSRVVRRRIYNAFWYTHQLYLPFMALLMIHPLSGVLKEEVLTSPSDVIANDTIIQDSEVHKFVAIKSTTWLWMAFPLICFFIDMLWRICTRNLSNVQIVNVNHMVGRTISLTLYPQEKLLCHSGQYVLIQCRDISLVEWHPFTVVQIPTRENSELVVWIKVKGDWTEALERALKEKGAHNLNVLVDGPFCSPLQAARSPETTLCVAAGVGITPFVALLDDMCRNPKSSLPGRIHLIWIVRTEKELTWIAELASNVIRRLRNANKPDRLHLEFYVTRNNDVPKVNHVVIMNETGKVMNVLDDERTTLLTPQLKRNKALAADDDDFDIAKKYPLVGCRVRRGRPHWDKVFGYWVHLYPGQHLNLYCCGPKKLVKLLRSKCKYMTRNTKTSFAFIHEAFS
ncbi:nadph oxidase [Danaus plexippus plexippus]|uniref:Nadph oxidase n=1 Tax=Danaus plexippus plexippus TaxID=278856 RepID=A0A212EKS1_DANPL|nr:nadph oxidase [Danaus plexippus plexippus]